MFDDFPWRLGAVSSEEGKDSLSEGSGGVVDGSKLRYVGGVDLSFAKEDSSFACGALVVMDLESMQVVYEDFEVVQLTMPYVAGFLAFREVLYCLPLFPRQFQIVWWPSVCDLILCAEVLIESCLWITNADSSASWPS